MGPLQWSFGWAIAREGDRGYVSLARRIRRSPMERKLKAEPRDGTGKGIARRLRAQGRVPAVVYGHGMQPRHVSVDGRELFHLLHTEAGVKGPVGLHARPHPIRALP